jgi:hypothetical protein
VKNGDESKKVNKKKLIKQKEKREEKKEAKWNQITQSSRTTRQSR